KTASVHQKQPPPNTATSCAFVIATNSLWSGNNYSRGKIQQPLGQRSRFTLAHLGLSRHSYCTPLPTAALSDGGHQIFDTGGSIVTLRIACCNALERWAYPAHLHLMTA